MILIFLFYGKVVRPVLRPSEKVVGTIMDPLIKTLTFEEAECYYENISEEEPERPAQPELSALVEDLGSAHDLEVFFHDDLSEESETEANAVIGSLEVGVRGKNYSCENRFGGSDGFSEQLARDESPSCDGMLKINMVPHYLDQLSLAIVGAFGCYPDDFAEDYDESSLDTCAG